MAKYLGSSGITKLAQLTEDRYAKKTDVTAITTSEITTAWSNITPGSNASTNLLNGDLTVNGNLTVSGSGHVVTLPSGIILY